MGNSCRVLERDCTIVEEAQRVSKHPKQKRFSKGYKEEKSGCMKECMDKEGGDKRGLVRVKILVTKQELALLLSKCDKNNGGILESIAREIKEKKIIAAADDLRNDTDFSDTELTLSFIGTFFSHFQHTISARLLK
ncbi:hypothetical protein QJS04_geneDACA011057 [Acorus gramineus]|uniref:DUF7890 domain-containing protein n=1 Tax=Acorus gramineus TaxID=55184 RepID=A0AAV9BFI8_ACOGR|nr:hypothetical protein QJS04_geneDACA011057 [Acorus gramineus]